MADKAASVLARIKNSSRDRGISYQQGLQLFVQEEFLRRLANSKFSENLVLKGGLFIFLLTEFESRATVDVDFLLQHSPGGREDMKEMIEQIISTDTGNDYIVMSANKYSEIAPHRKYKGISTQIIAKIKNVRVPFSVDIGVGDVIVPGKIKHQLPTQLPDFDAPRIFTYSLESTIAEKFDAILQRMELSSRMKDLYDIQLLSQRYCFDGAELQTAIFETLQTRGTNYDRDSFKNIMKLDKNESFCIRWNSFLRSIGEEGLVLNDVLASIAEFLEPVFTSILNEVEWTKNWDNKWN